MSEADALWAAWSPEAVTIGRSAAREESAVLPIRMPASLRYSLRLFTLADGTVLLRSADQTNSRLDRITREGTVQLGPELPAAISELAPYQLLPQVDGGIVGLNQGHLLLWSPGSEVRTRPGPAGFVIRDAARDSNGRLFICGAHSAARNAGGTPDGGRTTRAAWAVADDGNAWQVQHGLHGRFRDAWRAVWAEAANELRWIRVSQGYLLLAAIGGEAVDSSAHITVLDPRRHWHSATWSHDTFRGTAARPGHGLDVISHRGRRLRFIGGAPKEEHLDQQLRVALNAAGTTPPRDARIEVIDVEPTGSLLTAVISIRMAGPKGLTRWCEAIVALADEQPRVLVVRSANEPEVITAVTQPSAETCP